jgi:hypothetical protein
MRQHHYVLFAVCLSVAWLPVGPAMAYDQPAGLNLGFTSFLDGAPPAGPGWYFTEYIQYYTADEFPEPPGPVASDAQLDVWVSLNQIIYQSNQEVLCGGKWGLDVIVPVVLMDADDDNGVLIDNPGGLGDIYVGPFLQWDPIMGKNGPIFMHRIELQTIWPTGSYDDEKTLNPGSNYFSLNPYWAGTYFITPQLSASWRAHYLWNAKNNDPFVGYGVDDTQAGEAVHANFAVSYEVLPKQLRVGANGYWLKQISSSEYDGEKEGQLEEVLAIGPGALWSFSPDTHLFFNAYFETDTEVRPEGERFVLRLVHHF